MSSLRPEISKKDPEKTAQTSIRLDSNSDFCFHIHRLQANASGHAIIGERGSGRANSQGPNKHGILS